MLNTKATKAIDLLKDRMVRTGLSRGNTDYTKFIILGRFRTGSNFMLMALAQHPNILPYSELFIPMRIFWSSGLYGHRDPFDQRLLEMRDKEQLKFIEQKVYRPYPSKLQAVGFKVFYPHLEEKSNKVVRRYLADNKDIRVIHLKRKNLLDILVSHRVSEQTRSMLAVSEHEANQKSRQLEPFTIAAGEARAFFEQLEEEMQIYDSLFEGHEVFDLEYQDLAGDFSGTMQKVQDFLNVPKLDLQSATKKQNKRPKSELIRNYKDLQNAFEGTRFRKFFD